MCSGSFPIDWIFGYFRTQYQLWAFSRVELDKVNNYEGTGRGHFKANFRNCIIQVWFAILYH
jgi:hypothetical protein